MQPHIDSTEQAIARSGIRLTPQRRYVYEALMENRDHPTALEVFMRSKGKMPSISLATVYNCLDALTEGHLIRQVNCERGSSRYCANLEQHGHFFCDTCGSVFDVPLSMFKTQETWEVPTGTRVNHAEITLRGLCPQCAQKRPPESI